MLARHVPSRHLDRFFWISQVINYEDIANVTFHLSGDVSVIFIHIKAVNAKAVCTDIGEQTWVRRIRNIPNTKASVIISIFQKLANISQLIFWQAQCIGCVP